MCTSKKTSILTKVTTKYGGVADGKRTKCRNDLVYFGKHGSSHEQGKFTEEICVSCEQQVCSSHFFKITFHLR